MPPSWLLTSPPLPQVTLPNLTPITPSPYTPLPCPCPPGTLNSELTFRIVAGDPGGNFSIDGSTGQLALTRPLDFEALYGDGETRTVNLTVQVSDRGEDGR